MRWEDKMGRPTSFGDEQFKGITSESTFEADLVFVIMSFSKDLDDSYIAIKDECIKLNLNCIRVDETVGSGVVLKKIHDLIERAEFIIVDLTNERPNVYYELGYAHGIGNLENEILIVAKEGTELHFDIALLSVKYYGSTEQLRKLINRNLRHMIDVTRQVQYL